MTVVKAPLRDGFYSDIIWAVSLVKLLPAEVSICGVDRWKDIYTCSFAIISCSCYLEVLVIDLQVSLFALCFVFIEIGMELFITASPVHV